MPSVLFLNSFAKLPCTLDGRDFKQKSFRSAYSILFLQLQYCSNSDKVTFIDLDKLGGLLVVVGELDREEGELRTTAAWVLGKASQNNPVVQDQV
jgi:hypothetical protein